MSELFRDPELLELPAGIIDVDLDHVEAVVLKVLVFINEPMTKTDIKSAVKSILSSKVPYSNIKKAVIDRSIDCLEIKDIFVRYNLGFSVDPGVVFKILPLAKDNLPLVYFCRLVVLRILL